MLKQNENYSHFALAFILLADCLIREKRPPSGAINLRINTTPSTTKVSSPTTPPIETPIQPGKSTQYIGNKNSKKFHLPTCRTLPSPANRVYFNSRDEAIKQGYTPCGNCKP